MDQHRARGNGRYGPRPAPGNRAPQRSPRAGRRRRKRRNWFRTLVTGFCTVFCLGFVYLSILLPALREGEARSTAASVPPPALSLVGGGENNALLEGICSRNAVLADLESGEILAEKSGGERMYPASLTKIMTAVLALESFPDVSRSLTVPEDIFPALYEENASMAGFQPGEEASVRDLLYGALLPSGAECCLTLANNAAGSEEAFVEQMNQKAKELGMEHTHFSNCTGLQEEDHYSTARDLALLLRYALQNEEFRQAFTSLRYSVPPTAQHPQGFTFYSTALSAAEGIEISGGQILGGKTGFTSEAGLCLASLGLAGGREYILVTGGAPGDHSTEPYHLLDAAEVYRRAAAL